MPSPSCNCGLVSSPFIESGRIYLSLVVRLKRSDASSNTQGVLFKGKYPVRKEVITQKPASFWQSDWQGIENEITLSNQTISSNLRAWTKITIGENTTIASSNNQPIDIAAGEEINIVGDNIDIGDNTTLRLALPIECTATIPPVTQSRLSEFCGSNAYKDSRSFTKSSEENEAVTGLDNTAQVQASLDIYPMPASSIVNIVYNVSQSSPLKILVSDQYGRIVATVVEELSARRNGLVKFDISNLNSGLYHCILQTDSEYIVMPLSVIH
ncbi:MAG: T9SS type A sorting domain-containing protein [Bacteroidetes bacterium]|nr:T9SS type A sorting domain-containing protein [Bacteroidota bacterium]